MRAKAGFLSAAFITFTLIVADSAVGQFEFSDELTDTKRDKIYDQQLVLISQYLAFNENHFAAADCDTRGYKQGEEGWDDCLFLLTPFYKEQNDRAAREALIALGALVAEPYLCDPQCPRKKRLLAGMKISVGGDHPLGGGYCNGLIINGRCYGSTFTDSSVPGECYGEWTAEQCRNDYFAE